MTQEREYMKFSHLEKMTLCLTALALAFLGGWFANRQYEINRQFVPVATDLPSPQVSSSAAPQAGQLVQEPPAPSVSA